MRSLKKYILPLCLSLLLVLTLCACKEDPATSEAGTTAVPTLPVNRPTESQPATTSTAEPGSSTSASASTSTNPGIIISTEPETTAAPTTAEPLAYYPFEPGTTGIYLTRDGEIQSAEITDFDNSAFETPRYNIEDLKAFVDSRVKAYNDAKGTKAIKVESLAQKDQMAELILSYATIQDFMDFQGAEFGVRHLDLMTRENAIRNYDIKNLADTEGNKVDILTALKARDAKVLIVSGKTHITINGNISYLSDNLILTGVNSVRCDSDQGYSYIIFR